MIGNENQLSSGTEFICWAEVPIDTIDPNLTSAFMGRKGVVVSGPAQKLGIFGISDENRAHHLARALRDVGRRSNSSPATGLL